MIDEGAGPVPAIRTARNEVPEPGAEIGAREDRVRNHTDEQHDGDGVGHVHDTGTSRGAGGSVRSSGLGPYGTSRLIDLPLFAPPPAHASHHENQRRSDREIQRGDDEKGDPHTAICRRGVLHAQVTVDDPGLASDFGHDPSRFQRDHREDPRTGRDPEEQLALRHAPFEQPGKRVPNRE